VEIRRKLKHPFVNLPVYKKTNSVILDLRRNIKFFGAHQMGSHNKNFEKSFRTALK
jgi:hypothetical protein